MGTFLALAYVYLQDFLSFAGDSGTFWCPDRYGFPAQFDYTRGGRERIAAGITDWWSWTRPGLTCAFGDVVTKDTVVVQPPASRSTTVVILVTLLAVEAVFLLGLVLRRRRSALANES